jgi:hypothetical protein
MSVGTAYVGPAGCFPRVQNMIDSHSMAICMAGTHALNFTPVKPGISHTGQGKRGVKTEKPIRDHTRSKGLPDSQCYR